MGMVKKSITVTDQQEEWVKTQIASGDYGNDSEVFRDLIRQKQAENTGINAIRAALIKAEERGFSSHTPAEIKQAVQNRMKKDGELQTQ
ncbi:MAG: type II toxin-antitoxin system ParD family antitoxin [Candidatus Anammoxibacter sp.]